MSGLADISPDNGLDNEVNDLHAKLSLLSD
jgi:hypothetical protein